MAELAGEIRGAGAVLWRPQGDGSGVEVALVHRRRYDDWTFPKGKSLPREHVLMTAVREVREETGMPVVLGRRLTPARYLSEGRPKRVDYWAARPAADPAFAPNPEVDQLEWLPAPAARKRLTYPHDVALLEEFASAPAATVPIILLRHASAVGKNDWRAAGQTDDLARPLTDRGRAQARALAGMLACYGNAQVLTSGAERCAATVRPYADAAGAVIKAESALEPGCDDAALRPLVSSLLDEPTPTIVCAHRENLPSLVELACVGLGGPVAAGPPLRKGAFWVLQAAQGRLVSAERHHPLL